MTEDDPTAEDLAVHDIMRCPVCGQDPHTGFTKRGGVTVPTCPNVDATSRGRYLEQRRELARLGVAAGHLSDGVFDRLVSLYGSPAAAVEALARKPRTPVVAAIAGARKDSKPFKRPGA